MTILDTFYILVKSNSKEAAKDTAELTKSTEALDKKIGELAKKGKQRTEDEEKQLKDLRKQRTQGVQDLKDQEKATGKVNEETDKLGKNYTKLADGIGSAITAYVGLAAVQGGIINATQFNSKLKVQSDYLKQNAQDMYAVGAAAEQYGYSADEARATVERLTVAAQQQGRQLPPILDIYRKFHEQLSSAARIQGESQARLIGTERMHLDQGTITILMQQGDAWERLYEAKKKLAPSAADLAAAREFEAQWSQTTQVFQHLFTELSTDVLPTLSSLLKMFNEFVIGNPHEAKLIFEDLATGVTLLSGALALRSAGIIANFLGIGAAANTALIPLARFAALAYGAWNIGEGIGDIFGGSRQSPLAKGAQFVADHIDRTLHPSYYKNSGGGGNQSSLEFWMKQGYTREQAAGLVANEMAESGGNAGARGDNGSAVGLFQWHPDRVAAILAGTGIDVRTANHADQLKAAAWELHQRGNDVGLKRQIGAFGSGAYVSSNFEVPRDLSGEAIKRGQAALAIASQSSLGATGGGNNISVKTGDININTQATDADGIAAHVSQSLQSHLRSAISNSDDGVLA